MAAKPESEENTHSVPVEIKSATFTLPVIHLFDIDMDAVAEHLGARVEQAPEFFRNTPVIIDLSTLPPQEDDIRFPSLVGLLRGYGMVPVGIRGGNAAQNQAAAVMELAIMRETTVRNPDQTAAQQESKSPTQATETAPEPVSGSGAEEKFKLITHPVRSGQRIYAAAGDLSVVGSVSSGAELLADGNIHVYGPLRGRAMAGINGDPSARIFCQDLAAELVAVAGRYRVSERIPAAIMGVPVQIFLDHEILRIEKL